MLFDLVGNHKSELFIFEYLIDRGASSQQHPKALSLFFSVPRLKLFLWFSSIQYFIRQFFIIKNLTTAVVC